MLLIIIKSLIIGFIGGAALTAGAARMFHTPNSQSMGAFRTLGELNACQGDTMAHFSFGLGFLFNSAAAVVASGALTQDVFHRVIPNFAAATLLLKNKKVEETLYDPLKMGIVGGIIGAIIVAFLNTVAFLIPASLSNIAREILSPAAAMMINPVMPIVFWLAALDAGKLTGVWATVLGGLAHMIMGNAVPGIVLGILIGQTIDESGYNKSVRIMITIVVILFIVIAYFRGFFAKLGL
ncbi:MAG: DUF4311 domain-containing protein [Fusobacterium mortiferum]|jgi:uncharacterized protein (TIGR03580 family)|uniref:EF_0832/AHA_3913 family protein n=1 Tax=Fusobacterium mortiferum ATCC 9817 TaxID=469616 RepID=A0ABM6TUW0_FUSMR|nr:MULTISPECIES: DUF4311 domain-containing protein [Fusobacterium]AVQ17894.1 hypothetical protein C4N19_01610 [Fusobacterium mortiferum ATCC 9817]EEO36921.1 EF_0832/AHA_3913 family protein [Fusobacterium mortiferum ATCC 9817]MCF2700001.1 DUF4311 domain-containing protein [Fusobacterium mortiferum]MCI7666091.1 DUF4311 domain-containing protein [Fusobacterium mortiferum]MSS61922.1 DUF4311 domain-containing protein [Fusobacterium sp. FSA-380-WT-2B]